MNIFQNAPASQQTFRQFLFYNRRNRTILYVAAATIIIQFAIFKYLYPFANYIHDDSFVYLDAAYENSTIATYPIGYSKFIRLVNVFAKPDLVLVILQHLLIQCSTLFLLFTLFYFYKTSRVTQTILLCFMGFNPLFLQLANLVSSDGFFLALSMTWFALLTWIIYKPSNKIIGWHAVVLFAAFTVRYNALIYPFIALLAFGLSNLSLRKKIAGLGFALLLIGWFVGLSMFQFKKLTGYWQFSPFSGWQWANNAMNVYREVDDADREPVPPQFSALDARVRNLFYLNPNLGVVKATPAYMWTRRFPLMQYRDSLFENDLSASELKKWASMGPIYKEYGLYIIKKYPLHFIRHFIGPNSKRYFVPPLEYLTNYNWGSPIVPESVVTWFGYENNQVKTRTKNGSVYTLQYYPYVVSITNIIMLLMLLSYMALKGWQYNTTFNKIILLAGLFWITYAGFNIFTAPTVLRYQAFPAALSFTFSLLLIDWMARLMQHLKLQGQQQKPDSEYSQKALV